MDVKPLNPAAPPRGQAVPASDGRPPVAATAPQPFVYPLQREFVEPDWTRIPGYRRRLAGRLGERALAAASTPSRTCKELKAALGELLPDTLLRQHRARPARAGDDVASSSRRRCSTRWTSTTCGTDPVRRYMLPAFDDRRTDWPNHPRASRDSLHEAEMWVVEGLTHRYPTKVLAEMLSTCPQYCGHCTRMDLVGNDVPQVEKHQLRHSAARALRADPRVPPPDTPGVRDVVVSGGDIANLPIQAARDVRRAAARHPQHPRHPPGLEGLHGHCRSTSSRTTVLAGAGAAGEEGVRARRATSRCTPT